MGGRVRTRRQDGRIHLKTAAELALMREAGRIVALTLERLREYARPGITTAELDALAEATIRSRGAVPAFKGYRGFPASVCTSINQELVHGIPSPDRILAEGDVISLDVGAIYQGWYGDAAISVPVGEISPLAQRLLAATEGALYAAIAQARAGNRLRDISAAVQAHVESRGFAVVREYTGHGIGRAMHELPEILNFVPDHSYDMGPWLQPGMTLALEPMVQAGTWRTRSLADGWTVVSADGSLAAHFEHTIAITDGEPEILTRL
ncbi:MAG: type I methionyl aminopeptidase [Anaerolineae bacterium]|nr:type I methionyl aminopeptidase [Anaerolineae bacterium]